MAFYSKLQISKHRVAGFARLIGAVLLQDMRTRYGTSALGYLIAVAWPLSHLSFITAAYYLKTLVAPVGDSTTMFIATGAAPYILCLYSGRMIGSAIQQNRQLLFIPLIKPIHLIFSRSILEMLNSVVVLAIFIFCISMADVNVSPSDYVEAAKAVGSALFLGFGFGFLNVVMCALVGPYFMVFFVLVMVGLYLSSGVYLPIWMMPQVVRDYGQYNPILVIVEWMRSAYFVSYDNEPINKTLVIVVASISLVFGLLGERYLRGKILAI